MARSKKHGRKRDQPALEIDGEQEVDDMAIAAQFAALTYPVASGPTQPPTTDDNEIHLDGDDSDDDCEAKEKGDGDSPTVGTNSSDEEGSKSGDHENVGADIKTTNENDEGEDDDDSHVDMTAELAELERMEQAGGDDAAPPKTENELDSYHTPLSELEKKFQLNLTVEESKKYTPDRVKICEAGKVTNHMIQERTIIVESLLRDGSTSPLDEGSLLVFHIRDCSPKDKKLVPIGRIFEVFGPVRKPLYTIRLPSPAEMKAMQTLSRKGDSQEDNQKEIGKNDGNTPKDVSSSAQPKQEGQNPEISKKSDAEALSENDGKHNESQKEETSGRETKQQLVEEKSDSSKIVDHWSSEGEYTLFLRNNPDLTVFYVQDEAKVIDADAIVRLSAKGCDASNVYDEEIVNVNEMYFSDDEEERQLKGKNKNRKNNAGNNGNRRDSSQQLRHRPQRGRGGFRQAGPVPSGFHHQPMAPHHLPHPAFQQAHQGPHHPIGYGAVVPPPPPPPPGAPHHQIYPPAGYAPASGYMNAYGHYPPYGASNPPPPPPYPNPNPQYAYNSYPPSQGTTPTSQNPPQNPPGQPSAQQQSDTVYYDYI